MQIRKEFPFILVLMALSFLLFGSSLGKMGLMDPDEPFYSLTAKEMLQRGDPSTPFMFDQPQFEKPILFYWVLYYSFKYLGVNEAAARIGPCIAGVLTVLLTYVWGLTLFRRRSVAFMAAAGLALSGQFIVLSRIVLTDIFLCLFVTGALCSFSLGYRYERHRRFFWNVLFIFCGLGVLTKGPLGIMLPFFGITTFLLVAGESSVLKKMPWVSGLALFSVIALPWYVLMTQRYGNDFLGHFMMHENVRRFFIAEHKGMDKWFFYPLVLSIGLFPWVGLLVSGLPYVLKQAWVKRTSAQKTFLFLCLSAMVPLVFFTLAKSKLMSYIFPIYPVFLLMTAAWSYRLIRLFRMGIGAKLSLRLIMSAGWGLFPMGLCAAAYSYSQSQAMGLGMPIIVISALLIPSSLIALALLWKGKLLPALMSMAFGTICFVLIAFGWMMPLAQTTYSSKGWAGEYDKLISAEPNALFLASKMFVRGLTFYTGAENIGVFSQQPRGGFYTLHPIRMVTDVKEFWSMDPDDLPVYFMIRRKEWKHLNQNLDPSYKLSILKDTVQRMLVKLDHV
jgi:4-amino-4-deoxy-L-arabinose transferase-like glycosyltransferase